MTRASVTPKWIIPFKGRHPSGACTQNFLWRENNVYIMDNHRAALWCWFQHLNRTEHINYLHIDRHYDTLQSNVDEWVSVCPDLWSIGIEEYLSFKYREDAPLFTWDNYGAIFLKQYGHLVNSCKFATHEDGDQPNFEGLVEVDIRDLPFFLSNRVGESQDRWVVNLDLDFFCPDSQKADKYSVLMSDKYFRQIFSNIRRHLEDKRISCFTMCLSPDPEYCGSWEAAEKLCSSAVNVLGIDFKLPDTVYAHEAGNMSRRALG